MAGGVLLLAAAAAGARAACDDSPGWRNAHGKTCADYAALYCADGAFHDGHEWVGGEPFGYPERNCCACGKPPTASPPPTPVQITYELHHNLACKGADHQVKKVTVTMCQEHCSSRKCACFHFGKGLCRFGFKYLGLVKSTSGFAAYVRTVDGKPVEEESTKPPSAPATTGACTSRPPRAVPSFFMYDGKPFDWAERLTECFHTKNGRGPWEHEAGNYSLLELGPRPPVDLAHSLWLHRALASHRRRTTKATEAALFVVPAFGALSEAAGICEGSTHIERMKAAAAALESMESFKRAPARHVVFAAGVLEGHNALGPLGPPCPQRDHPTHLFPPQHPFDLVRIP